MKFSEARRNKGPWDLYRHFVIRSFIATDSRVIKGPSKLPARLYATQSSLYFFITVDTRKKLLYCATTLRHLATPRRIRRVTEIETSSASSFCLSSYSIMRLMLRCSAFFSSSELFCVHRGPLRCAIYIRLILRYFLYIINNAERCVTSIDLTRASFMCIYARRYFGPRFR